MKGKKILFSVLTIMLMVSLLVGGTLAWFTHSTTPIENVFTAGTVKITADEIITGDVDTMDNWNPGNCVIKEFTITNEGTKSIALRGIVTTKWYEYVEGGTTGTQESLWNQGTKVSGTETTGALARYFSYTVGQGSEEAPISKRLGIGQGIDPRHGQIFVWNDNTNIYVKMTTDVDSPMTKADLYISQNKPTTTEPGQFGNKYEPGTAFNTHTFTFPIATVGNKVYIMSHADATVGNSNGTTGSWVEWTPPTTDSVIVTYAPTDLWTYENGVYYYNGVIAGTFTSGQPVSVDLDLKVCFNKNVPNEYQGKRFILTATFEAIQASNGAPIDQWSGAPASWKSIFTVQ